MFEKIKAYLNLRYFLYFFALIAGWPCVFFLNGMVASLYDKLSAIICISSIFSL